MISGRKNSGAVKRKKGWLILERIGPEETSHWPELVHP
jgi:hypothetical protein